MALLNLKFTCPSTGDETEQFMELEDARQVPRLLLDQVEIAAKEMLPHVEGFQAFYFEATGNLRELTLGSVRDALELHSDRGLPVLILSSEDCTAISAAACGENPMPCDSLPNVPAPLPPPVSESGEASASAKACASVADTVLLGRLKLEVAAVGVRDFFLEESLTLEDAEAHPDRIFRLGTSMAHRLLTDVADIALFYEDEDGDRCTLTPETAADALAQALSVAGGPRLVLTAEARGEKVKPALSTAACAVMETPAEQLTVLATPEPSVASAQVQVELTPPPESTTTVAVAARPVEVRHVFRRRPATSKRDEPTDDDSGCREKLAALQRKIAEQAVRLTDSNECIELLSAQLEELKSVAQSNIKRAEENRKAFVESDEERTHYKALAAALQEELDETKKVVKAKNEQNKVAKALLSWSRQRESQARKSAVDTGKQHNKHAEEVEQAMNDLRARVTELEEAAVSANVERSSLEKRLAEVQSELDVANRDCEELKTRVAAAELERELAREALARCEANAKASRSIDKKAKETQTKLTQAEKDLEKLRSELTSEKAKNVSQRAADLQASETKEKLRHAEKELHDLREELASEKANAKRASDRKSGIISELQVKLAGAEKDISRRSALDSAIAGLRSQLEARTAELAASRAAAGRDPRLSAKVIASEPEMAGVEMDGADDPAAVGDVSGQHLALLERVGAKQAFRIGRSKMSVEQDDCPIVYAVTFRNDGQEAWPATAMLVHESGPTLDMPVKELGAVARGGETTVYLELMLPKALEVGRSSSVWVVREAATGRPLGAAAIFEIDYVETRCFG